MDSHFWFRGACMAVVVGFGLAHCARSGGQAVHAIHSGAQVGLIARMPDSFTIQWPSAASVALEASVPTGRKLDFKLGRLLPGANAMVECRSGRPDGITAQPSASSSPGALIEGRGSVACDGVFRAAKSETIEFIKERPATSNSGILAGRIDVVLSVI